MAAGKGWLEKLRRIVRTMYFVVAMVASLLVTSLPLLVAIGDIMLPCLLISNFTCVTCHTFNQHLHRYTFNSSLTDIPLVSIIRSLVITCVYSMCDGPALSQGPYLGTVALSSIVSILLLSVKACVFSVNSQIEAEASLSLSKRKLHLKKSWGMPVLFLSSVVFALGHVVIAYRTSCRARRKLLLHRVDPESVLSCKISFYGYQKVPRHNPISGKTLRSDSELKKRPVGDTSDEGELPIQLLADTDSMFMTCQGLNLHYKLSLPGAPSRSMSSSTFLNRPSVNVFPKSQFHLHKSFSSQFDNSSLHMPLLDRPTYPDPQPSEEIPVLSLDEADDYECISRVCSPAVEMVANGQFGIVLVHGFGGGTFSWRHVMSVLARQVGCTVAAFDRPGWGLTSRPRKQDWEENKLPNPYKLESQVDLLLNFCLEMGFSSVVLVGHDDGGLLALKAAQKVRSSGTSVNVEIKGVVLLNVSLSREVVPAFARILLQTPIVQNTLVNLLRAEITQVVNRCAWYDSTKLTTKITSIYKAPLFVEGWVEALYEVGRLSFETVLSPKDAACLVAAIDDIPVLVIAGAEDSLVPLKSVQNMASRLVNSRLVAISGCGHLPHEECPKALLAALLPFISRL